MAPGIAIPRQEIRETLGVQRPVEISPSLNANLAQLLQIALSDETFNISLSNIELTVLSQGNGTCRPC